MTSASQLDDSAKADAGRVEGVRSPGIRLPHGLTSTRFGLLIGAILVGGLIALLAVNTSLAAGAIELGGLESTLARTTEQQQALDLAVEDLSSPQALQNRAIALGMVPAPAPVFLDTATGRLSGQIMEAQPLAPQTSAPMVTVPEPTPAPVPTLTGPGGTATSSIEPPATLVMPPDRGADGASVTRPAPSASRPAVAGTPGAGSDSATTQDGEPVLQDDGTGDAAVVVPGVR